MAHDRVQPFMTDHKTKEGAAAVAAHKPLSPYAIMQITHTRVGITLTPTIPALDHDLIPDWIINSLTLETTS